MVGKEGPETNAEAKGYVVDKNHQNLASFTEEELEKYWKIQKEYLQFLIDLGLPVPKDKNELFKILIMKDYYAEDEKKYQAKQENERRQHRPKFQKLDRR